MTETGFFDFHLFAYPNAKKAITKLKGAGQSGVLVVLTATAAAQKANLDFLENILKAAQLAPTETHIYRLDLAANTPFALAHCCRELDIKDVLIFGDLRNTLGIRAQLPAYSFTRIGQVHYLQAHDIEQLRQEREKGQKQHAGALWQALKVHYL